VLEISNVPRDYAWGSRGGISALRGIIGVDSAEAEVWLGDHREDPADVVGDEQSNLREWISANLDRAGGGHLPFLLKILAADKPLSIQAHPTIAQAGEGFARENSAGVPVDAANRNYRDAHHKPEVIVALQDGFRALAGFRPVVQTDAIVADIAQRFPEAGREFANAYARGANHVVEWLLSGNPLAASLSNSLAATTVEGEPDVIQEAYGVAAYVATFFPADPGVVVAALLNHVELSQGEALFVPAGHLHAYLSGIGIEVMAASDNVVRGGLTSKHIDTAELVKIMSAEQGDPYRLAPAVSAGVSHYVPPVDDFTITRVQCGNGAPTDAVVSISGPAVAVVTAGELDIVVSERHSARPTQAFFVEAGETISAISGLGAVFIAHQTVR
jgi:mannose-6-phosphate isomerase